MSADQVVPRHASSVVLDMDFGIDDAMALLYLLRSDVEIVAIGTVHGNTTSESAARNADQLLRVAGVDGIPIAQGADTPLLRELHVAAEVHGVDGIGGTSDGGSGQPNDESAAEQLVRLARLRPDELTVLATGPLTNLALALELEPRLPALLHSVVVMGGAVHAPGNITSFAEANIWHDPEAAQAVFGAFDTLTLVPLDLTHRAWLDGDALGDVMSGTGPALGDLVRRMLPQYIRFNESANGRPGFPLHDPSAAVLLVHPGYAEYEQTGISVGLDDEQRGATRPGSGQRLVDVALLPRDDIVSEFTRVAFG